MNGLAYATFNEKHEKCIYFIKKKKMKFIFNFKLNFQLFFTRSNAFFVKVELKCYIIIVLSVNYLKNVIKCNLLLKMLIRVFQNLKKKLNHFE